MSNKSEPLPEIWVVHVPMSLRCQPGRVTDQIRKDRWGTYCSRHQTIVDATVALFPIRGYVLTSLNALLDGQGFHVGTYPYVQRLGQRLRCPVPGLRLATDSSSITILPPRHNTVRESSITAIQDRLPSSPPQTFTPERAVVSALDRQRPGIRGCLRRPFAI